MRQGSTKWLTWEEVAAYLKYAYNITVLGIDYDEGQIKFGSHVASFSIRFSLESGAETQVYVTTHGNKEGASDIEYCATSDVRFFEEAIKRFINRMGDNKPTDKTVAPDIVAPLIGYRTWSFDRDYKLYPRGIGFNSWDGPNEVKAVCRVNTSGARIVQIRDRRSHEAPHHDCECGFHAWASSHELLERHASINHGVIGGALFGIRGAILARGVVEAHNTGFRAEYVKPMAYAYIEEEEIAYLKPVALAHKLPLMPLEELSEFCRLFGTEMPRTIPPLDVKAWTKKLRNEK